MNEKYSSSILLCVSTDACLILRYGEIMPDQGELYRLVPFLLTCIHKLKTYPVTSVDP